MGKRVTVARLGSEEDVPPYKPFENDATVNDILDAFGVDLAKGETLAIDGKSINGNHKPEDEDVIYVSPSTTGA